MDRRERVNSEPQIDVRAPWREVPQAPVPVASPLSEAVSPRPASWHPCLYIGRSGERCSRPAVRGDFCSRHAASDPEAPSEAAVVKRLIGVAGVIVVLWPIIVDLVREILRLLR